MNTVLVVIGSLLLYILFMSIFNWLRSLTIEDREKIEHWAVVWLTGFVQIVEGLVKVITLGFVRPSWQLHLICYYQTIRLNRKIRRRS